MCICKLLSLLIIIDLFILCFNVQTSFEKIIWVYWNDDIQKAGLFIKLCAKKFQIVAQKQNWKLNILNDGNMHQHLSNYDKYLDAVQKSQRQQSSQMNQAKSDLIRLSVLAQHGGVWFDLSTILLDQFDFTWMEELDKYEDFIINKEGQSADVLMFSFGQYQSTNIYLTGQGHFKNQYPGYCMWFIAAVKGSELMRDWRDTYFKFTMQGMSYYHEVSGQEDVYMRRIDQSGFYWSGNQALTYAIHKKQFQLDRNTSILQRTSASQYYKVWTLPGQIGPISAPITGWERTQHRIFYRTIDQIKSQFGQILFFLKFSSAIRDSLQQKIDRTTTRLQNHEITIQQMLQSKPTPQNCSQLYFVLEGSIISQLFSALPEETRAQYGNIIISEQQRDRWQSQCQNVVNNEGQQLPSPKDAQTVPQGLLRRFKAKIESFIHKIQTRFFVGEQFYSTMVSHTLLLRAYKLYKQEQISTMEFLAIFVKTHYFYFSVYVFIYIIWLLALLILRSFYGCLLKEKVTGILEKLNVSYFRAFQQSRQTKNSLKQKMMGILIILMKLCSISLCFCLWYCMIYYGVFPMDILLLCYLLFVLGIDKVSIYLLHRSQTVVFGLCVEDFIIFTKGITNFYLTYGLMTCFYMKHQNILYNAIILGFISPCLIKLSKQLTQNRNYSHPITKTYKLVRLMNKITAILNFELISLLLLLVLVVCPNCRFVTLGNDYLRHHIAKTIRYITFIWNGLVIYLYLQQHKHLNQKINNGADKSIIIRQGDTSFLCFKKDYILSQLLAFCLSVQIIYSIYQKQLADQIRVSFTIILVGLCQFIYYESHVSNKRDRMIYEEISQGNRTSQLGPISIYE